jgi:hypothetical protein
MDNPRIYLILVVLISVIALTVSLFYMSPSPAGTADDKTSPENASPDIPEINCSEYTFSTCPEGCTRRCMPSSCGFDPSSGMEVCTDDCDGPGSCY